MLSHWDPLFKIRVDNVKTAQGERLQAHYLSPDSQNEFISECAIKYYSIIVDVTPDSSHKEQETIILLSSKK